jgi:hypothetical protein
LALAVQGSATCSRTGAIELTNEDSEAEEEGGARAELADRCDHALVVREPVPVDPSNAAQLLRRFSDWVVVHPVWWGVGSGAALVLLGLALDLAPIVVVAAGAAVGVLNILHARRRGYCPRPAAPGSDLARAEAE